MHRHVVSPMRVKQPSKKQPCSVIIKIIIKSYYKKNYYKDNYKSNYYKKNYYINFFFFFLKTYNNSKLNNTGTKVNHRKRRY